MSLASLEDLLKYSLNMVPYPDKEVLMYQLAKKWNEVLNTSLLQEENGEADVSSYELKDHSSQMSS